MTAERGPLEPDESIWSAPMPAWIPRLILMVVVAVFAGLGAYIAIQRLRDLIFWLIAALFLSFALEPAVNWLHAHGWRRGVATFAVLFGLILVAIVLIASMIPLVIRQIQGLIDLLPGWLDRLSVYTQRWFHVDISTKGLLDTLQNANQSLAKYAQNLAGNLLGFGAKVVGAVFQLLTIGLFTFYLVADGPRVRRAVCSILSPKVQREVLGAWDVAIDKTGGYLYSRLLLAAVSGASTFLVLAILGVPFALPLALWEGVMSQFIPVVGTYIAMVVPLLVAVLDKPVSALILLIFLVVYQQVENYLLSPRITARTMELHPAVAFGAVIAGASLMGPIGAILALPAAAILQAGLGTYLKRHEVVDAELTRDEPSPVEPLRRQGSSRSRLIARLRRRPSE